MKQLIRRILGKKVSFLLSGLYENYDQASKDVVSDTNYLNSNFIKEIKFSENPNINTKPRHIFSSILFSFEDEIKNILEFGGGNEPVFKYIQRKNKNQILNYVIEKKELIEQIKLPENLSKNIIYLENFKELDLKSIDAAIFNTSIQYLKNFEEILNEIIISKIKYVVISDTIFSNFNEHKYTLQINMKPAKFIYILLSFEKLNNFFIKNNYELIYNISEKNHFGEKIIKNIHETVPNQDLNFKSLIYKLIK